MMERVLDLINKYWVQILAPPFTTWSWRKEERECSWLRDGYKQRQKRGPWWRSHGRWEPPGDTEGCQHGPFSLSVGLGSKTIENLSF